MTHHDSNEQNRSQERRPASAQIDPVARAHGVDTNQVGPEEMVPLDSPEELASAWEAAKLTTDPDAMRHRIITVAHNKNWEDSLPSEARDWMRDRE